MQDSSLWEAFRTLNARRRAIRHFREEAIPDHDLEAIIAEAQLAPSSNNAQPYEFICVRSPAEKAEVARNCRDQRAAASASVLIVLVCGRRLALHTLRDFSSHLQQTTRDAKSLAYHRVQTRKAQWFLAVAAWSLWSPLVAIFTLMKPAAVLLPLGANGVKHWCVRSGLFAAQNLMLAASAAGLDTCPMEGFNAIGLARYLKLSRDAVIPLVIAVGHRAADARLDERWRKPFPTAAQFI